MQETMFIIEFMNGKQKRFDDDRFRYEVDLEAKTMMVYSRISKGVVLVIPNLDNIAYIHPNVIKKPKRNAKVEEEIEEVSEEMPEEEAMLHETYDD